MRRQKTKRAARPKVQIRRDTVNMRILPAPAGFPAEVRLRGAVYQVTYATPLWHEGQALMGRVAYDERRILIDAGLEPHTMREVLLHEIFHVYANEANMPTGTVLENILDVFASAFCDIRDNNALI